MPTIISHSIVALSLAPCFGGKRVPRSLAALGAFCAIAPDFDVIGLRLGIPYGSMFGHRGFSHSLVFAVLLAVAASVAYRTFESSASATSTGVSTRKRGVEGKRGEIRDN